MTIPGVSGIWICTNLLSEVDCGGGVTTFSCCTPPPSASPSSLAKALSKLGASSSAIIPGPKGLSGGAIAGIVIGSVAGVIAIAVLLFFFVRYQRRMREEKHHMEKAEQIAPYASERTSPAEGEPTERTRGHNEKGRPTPLRPNLAGPTSSTGSTAGLSSSPSSTEPEDQLIHRVIETMAQRFHIRNLQGSEPEEGNAALPAYTRNVDQ